MKVSKCSEPDSVKKVGPKRWSYPELRSAPLGVYREATLSTGSRWINLGDGTLLFYHPGSSVLEPSTNASGPFIQIENAIVCFEIREPKA